MSRSFIRQSGRSKSALLAAGCLLLTACAGGGGGGSLTATPPAPPPAPPPAAPSAADYETHEYNIQWGLGFMNVSHAFAAGAFGEDIVVAVIDSGIIVDSPELAGRVSENSVSIHEYYGGTLGDLDHPHGTFIASTIAANRNDSGTHGVAPEATILDIRVDQGVENPDIPGSSFPYYTEQDFARAIDYAVDNGADIISLSIARPPTHYESGGAQIYAALRRAVEAGIIITIGSGNYGPGVDIDDRVLGDFLPAAFADDPAMQGQIVVVPALGRDGLLTDFSARADIMANFAIAAPGEEILVSLNGENYLVRGTSFAGPHVAGALALLMSAFPNLEGSEALQILYDTAQDLGEAGIDDVYGHGAPDMEEAFAPQGQTSMRMAGGSKTADVSAITAMPSGAFGDWAWESALYDDAIFQDRYDRVYSMRSWLDMHRPQTSMLPSFESAARAGLSPTRSIAFADNGFVTLRQPVDMPRIYNQLDPEMGREETAFSLNWSQGGVHISAGRGFAVPGAFMDNGVSVLSANAMSGATANLATRSDWSAMRYELGDWQIGLRSSGNDAAGFQAVSILRHIGDQQFGFEVGTVSERHTTLGSTVGTRLGNADDNRSSFQALHWSGALPAGWRGGARMEIAQADLSLPASFELVEAPLASAWTLQAHRPFLGGRFGFTVNQPLRAERGAVSTSIATGVDADWNLLYETRTGRLTPSGREISAEAAYRRTVFGGADASFATRFTSEPGHVASGENEVSVWLGLRSRY